MLEGSAGNTRRRFASSSLLQEAPGSRLGYEGLEPLRFGSRHFAAERSQLKEPAWCRALLHSRGLRLRRPIPLFNQAVVQHPIERAIQVPGQDAPTFRAVERLHQAPAM